MNHHDCKQTCKQFYIRFYDQNVLDFNDNLRDCKELTGMTFVVYCASKIPMLAESKDDDCFFLHKHKMFCY